MNIQIKNVTNVLLADGWHAVDEGSFRVDTYQLRTGNTVKAPSGTAVDGFEFGLLGERVAGPLSSVLAIRHKGD